MNDIVPQTRLRSSPGVSGASASPARGAVGRSGSLAGWTAKSADLCPLVLSARNAPARVALDLPPASQPAHGFPAPVAAAPGDRRRAILLPPNTTERPSCVGEKSPRRPSSAGADDGGEQEPSEHAAARRYRGFSEYDPGRLRPWQRLAAGVRAGGSVRPLHAARFQFGRGAAAPAHAVRAVYWRRAARGTGLQRRAHRAGPAGA